MGSVSSSKRAIISDINITPLTDIFLVLLIIMMVVAPMMRQLRGDITPPTVQAGAPVDQDKITVEVTSSGEYYIDGETVEATDLGRTLTEMHEAKKKLATEASGDSASEADVIEPLAIPVGSSETPEKKASGMLIIRADKKTLSRAVLTVFDAARTAGFEKVTLAGESPSDASVTSSEVLSPVEGGLDTSALDSW